MFNRITPLVRVPLRYGLISGLIGFILLIALFYMDKHPLLVLPFFDFRIVIFSVFGVFALRELRDYYFDGLLFFWQGMIGCFILTFVFALSASGLLLIFTTWEPRFLSSFIQLSIDQAKTFTPEDIERIGRTNYEEGIARLQQSTGLFMARSYFFQSFIISFFISIIISVILRRQLKTH